jgi:hypothetical protein
MPRRLVIAVAVAGLVAAAAIDRHTSGVRSEDVRAAAAKLDAVPAAFGAWTSTDVPMPEKVLKVAEAAGHVSRSYTKGKNGGTIRVLLLCGPTGPIGAHEPKDCYAGNGYEMIGTQQKKAVGLPGGAAATYWTVPFEKTGAVDEPPIRVCWMWGVDGEWRAAEDPRTEYALRGALYKLYVTRSEPPTPGGASVFRTTAGAPATDPIDDFLTEFLPQVNAALTDRPPPK